ncbi:MAG: NadS family protein [Kiritimatiellia bacterium]
MNKTNFTELLESMQEGGEILRGTKAAARTWSVKDGRRVQTKEDVRALRTEFGVSQSLFAKIMGVSVNTLQNWEQGRRKPTGAARVLLTIASRQPVLFRQTLLEDCPELAHA